MKYKMPDLFTQIHEQDTRTPHGPHTFRGYHAAHVETRERVCLAPNNTANQINQCIPAEQIMPIASHLLQHVALKLGALLKPVGRRVGRPGAT